ncbi:MAG: sigma-70 family RNA polymerase sigma factor [Planctomycetes bacterium]|nr:sigma-70 family RNA polymerase sigma factor [Planctomycetota bacterium]
MARRTNSAQSKNAKAAPSRVRVTRVGRTQKVGEDEKLKAATAAARQAKTPKAAPTKNGKAARDSVVRGDSETKASEHKVNGHNHSKNGITKNGAEKNGIDKNNTLRAMQPLFRKVWTGPDLDAALAEVPDNTKGIDALVVKLNKEGVELSLGADEAPEDPRPARTRHTDRAEEASDPLSILFREAQRSPRPTRDEERRLFRRVLFTKRRLDRTFDDLNLSRDVAEAFVRNAPCIAFRPSEGHGNAAMCSADDQAPCVRFVGLCSMEIIHERCCSFHAARNGFIVRYLYLVLGMVRRYRDRGIDAADLVQEGSAALMRACEDFEPERGFRFSTYARWWVNQAFLRTMYNNLRTVRLPVYLQKAAAKVMRHAGDRDFREVDVERLSKLSGVAASTIRILAEFSRSTVSLDLTNDDRERVLSIADTRSTFKPERLDRPNVKNEVAKALELLDTRERTIIKLRFGLDASFPRTLEEVGEVLNLSRERVRQIQECALEKLRSPLHLERLRDLLDVD